MIGLEIGSETLGRLYPAYLWLSSDHAIRAAGPALQRITRQHLSGCGLADLVETLPDLGAAASDGRPITLRLRDMDITLSGSVIASDGDYFLAVGILPDRSWPLVQSLQISDFAPSDPVVAAIMQSGIQSALLAESKSMALDLAAERLRVLDLLGRISRSSAHMAHEFNNLISIIGLNCERLLRAHGDDAALSHQVQIIRDTALRGSAMTQAMMALAHRQDDTGAIFVLDEVLAAHRAYFSLIAGTSVVLEWQLSNENVAIRASRSALVDWLAEVLVSTGTAAKERSAIRVVTGLVAKAGLPFMEVRLSMAGAEIGRAAEERHLEHPAAFLHEAGGSAELVRRAGEVTELAIWLPVFHAPEEADLSGQAAGGQADAAGDRAEIRVLIVDDEPYALEALEELLEDIGYAVTSCDGPEAALAALAQQQFDVLLTDVIMPGISGIDLARTASQVAPEMAVVLMSGYLPEGGEWREDWQFLRKPLDIGQLVEGLANCRRGR